MATTAVELHAVTQLPVPLAGARQEEEPASDDDILQASRVADSTVPDGGYGWAVIFGCAVMTWWVCTFPSTKTLTTELLKISL